MQELEKKTEDMENKMETVMERLSKFELLLKDDPLPVIQDGSSEYKKGILIKLRKIRDTMKEEGSLLDTVKQERDLLQTENEQLKKQIDKLNYRILHLIRNMNE